MNTTRETLTFPGLIDPHTHLREPGGRHKEDFCTGTRAALKGGFTTVGVMPNTSPSITTIERLGAWKMQALSAVCPVLLYMGTDGNNMSHLIKAKTDKAVFGVKIYCNETTGDLLVEDRAAIREIFTVWESIKPILVHAEGPELLGFLFELAQEFKRRLYVCHVSTKQDAQALRLAKKNDMKRIHAEVTPHHLFLTKDAEQKQGNLVRMKPVLGTQEDQDALWEALNDGTIDCIGTDHAPHTLAEKHSDHPPFGVPGLETAVGLILTAAAQGKIPHYLLYNLLFGNAQKILRVPAQENTQVVIDLHSRWIVGDDGYETKCDWSPFHGWEMYGKVQEVVLYGKKVVEDGRMRI